MCHNLLDFPGAAAAWQEQEQRQQAERANAAIHMHNTFSTPPTHTGHTVPAPAASPTHPTFPNPLLAPCPAAGLTGLLALLQPQRLQQ